jgi:hypothetical protein
VKISKGAKGEDVIGHGEGFDNGSAMLTANYVLGFVDGCFNELGAFFSDEVSKLKQRK